MLPKEPLTLKVVILIDIENMRPPKQLTAEEHLQALVDYFTRAGPKATPREVFRIELFRGFGSTKSESKKSKKLFKGYREAGAACYTNFIDESEAADTLLTAHLANIVLTHVEQFQSRQPLLIVFLSNDYGFARTFVTHMNEGHQVVVVHDEENPYSLAAFESVAPKGMVPPICIPHQSILRRKFPSKLSHATDLYTLPDYIPLTTGFLPGPPEPVQYWNRPPGMAVHEERKHARDEMDDILDRLGWL
ncbi:hypothetical protein BDR26DRAFT_902747 [Obelidium mucronatum]|nr:hypothetical protein BDR26DRAFT_902747 [Obelidium mucronatum]